VPAPTVFFALGFFAADFFAADFFAAGAASLPPAGALAFFDARLARLFAGALACSALGAVAALS
jgi:hypothetical protein